MKLFGFVKEDESENNKEAVVQIELEKIKPNPFQPRKTFNNESIAELAESIKEYGVIQPVLLRKVEKDYELIAGERRFRACEFLKFERIPSIIRDFSDREVSEIAMVENLQREDLTYFEEAEGYYALQKDFGLTQEEIASRFGKGQSTIANKLRLLKLSPAIRKIIDPDQLSERHVRALLIIDQENLQREVLEKIVSQKLNVRQTEDLIEKMKQDKGSESEKIVRNIRRVVRDMRIFLNTIRDAVRVIKEAGMPADIVEEEHADYIEVRIRLPKNKH